MIILVTFSSESRFCVEDISKKALRKVNLEYNQIDRQACRSIQEGRDGKVSRYKTCKDIRINP